MIAADILAQLNARTPDERLGNLRKAVRETDFVPSDGCLVNNHIHTTYSFSPYSPSAAVFAARFEGLCTCGIVDHDSMGGALEFIEAGKITGIPTTVGAECRVSMKGTPFEGRRTNNPDQTGVSYMVLHGVPHEHIETVQSFFAPLRERRNERNRAMVANINRVTGVHLDFERDVLPLSEYEHGGSVTERHLMLALARALQPGLGMLEEYDLVGRLKKECIPQVYIPADAECPSLEEVTGLAKRAGALLCYAYLGDVTVSVTGDKKAQKFEDDYLGELLETLKEAGIRGITYMPTRNTDTQLESLRALCDSLGFLQVSGEDINSPRQSFVIEKLRQPQFRNLVDSTWAIIRHETLGETL